MMLPAKAAADSAKKPLAKIVRDIEEYMGQGTGFLLIGDEGVGNETRADTSTLFPLAVSQAASGESGSSSISATARVR